MKTVLIGALMLLFVSEVSGQPATIPTTQPDPTFTEAEFLSQLSTFRARGSVKFNPGIYAINNTIVLTLAGTYDMTGVELRGRKGTLIWIRGSGIHLIGPTFNSDRPATLPQGRNPKVGVQGVIVAATDVWIVKATWRNIDNGIQLFPGQRYLTLVDPTFTDELRGNALYCGGGDEKPPRGDVLWVGGSVGNSQQEQNIRCSTPGFSNLECHGVSFRNTNGKEAFGFRAGHGAKLVDCTFWGQYPTFLGSGLPQPLEACGDIIFDHCHFMDGPVNVRFCKDVQVLDCDFRTGQTPVTVSDADNVTVRGIRRIRAQPDNKPFANDITKTKKAIKDLGGHSMEAPKQEGRGNE
ncbi:MAG TPA: hypothetical protein VH370_17140 [Humisphaera sp.]|nr:hypothetical protein [Humisphaera sp.]